MKAWIRLNSLLPNSPKVAQVAQYMDLSSHDEALGLMVRWLCWVDMYCETEVTGLHSKDVDDMFGGNFCGALKEIGWVELHGTHVVICDFDKYLSPTSKKRACAANRVAKSRAAKKKGGER